MGSVGFDGEGQSQPTTSNGKKYKLPRTLREDFSAVNYASVPRKLRSVVKKRGHEPVLSISKKQRHVLTGVEPLRKNGAKKSKLNMKLGHITKDEEEVAETLHALAGMFSDANKANQPGSNDEPLENQPGLNDELLETESSAMLEAGSLLNAVEDIRTLTLREKPRKISARVTLEASCQSSIMVDSTAQVLKFQSLGDAQQPELPPRKQPAIPSASGVQSDLIPGHRPGVSAVEMEIPSGELAIDLKPIPATGIQYSKSYNPPDGKSSGLFLSPSLSATGVLSSETQGSCQRFPAWFESTNSTAQPRATENSVTPEKYTRVALESKTQWRRCSAHVYVSRLIKILQSDRKEVLLEKPTHSTTCGGAELLPEVSIHNETTGISARNADISFSGIAHCAAEKDSAEFQNNSLLYKRPLQDSATETSALCSSSKQGYEFLSLGSGVCDLDANECVHRAGLNREASKQFHFLSQNHSAMLHLLPQNGYSSTFHGHNSALSAQQAQPPQYLNSSFTSRTRQQLESQQQKWAAQLPPPYATGGVGDPHLPNWKNRGRESSSVLNYAHTLFPHLSAALASKYQQILPSEQQLMAMNSSLPLSNTKRHHNQLPLGFERNGRAFYHEKIRQLQLPCNRHL